MRSIWFISRNQLQRLALVAEAGGLSSALPEALAVSERAGILTATT